ncbi:MAG TPA: tryptophanase [Pseudomonadota bacterium]|nr:tryptophanase [Pseudomonadota bacterium]
MSDFADDAELAALVEPYRTKVVERIRLLSRAERERSLQKAHYSIVHLPASDIYIDLVTDSGTSAMSDQQWAGLMTGDESYMGSRNFVRFEDTVRKLTGYPHVIPTHQGRAAENIVMELLAKPGDLIASNTLFDTTRAHVHNAGARPVDLVGDCLWDFQSEQPFKGNVDLAQLATALAKHHQSMPFLVVTVVNNMAGSSPVAMANIRETRRLADRYGIPLLFDACRFAENAYFIKQREEGYRDKSIREICQEMFSYGHGCWMSAKKDGLVNIGGFIAVQDEALANRCRERLVLYEGFPTYGGLARRDLEAMAIGLEEGVTEEHLQHRIAQVAYLGELIERQAGVTISRPTGGSGVFLDVGSIYGHLPAERLPWVAFTADLYLTGGVRAAAAPFSLMRIDPRTGELAERIFQVARLAVPRRVYGKSHMDFVGLAMQRVKQRAHLSQGYKLVHQPEVLGHFFAKFEPWCGRETTLT